MAENVNNTIKTTVELDAGQAQQEIVKLNSLASDSTQDLEKRLESKNKQIELQNKLNKKAIADAEKQVKSLQNVVGKEKQLEKAIKKLEKAKLNEVKVNERNAKSQRKLAENYENSKGSLNKLNDATGGFIDKLKALAANPIVLVMTALVGVFQLFKKAINRSEEATASFAKIGAFISGVFNGFIAVLEPIVVLLGDTLVNAIEKPGEAWEGFVGILQKGYEIWKTQILDRFIGNFKILTGGFQSGILKMRIAWNEFTGDSDEAKALTDELEDVNKKIEEGYEAHRIANQQLIDGYNSAKDAVTSFAEKAKENYNQASKATLDLAGAERKLVKNRIALEKQQLSSLRLAEEQRQVRDDISKSFDERIAANKKLGDILDEQAKRELAIAQQNLDLARLKQQADGKTIESIEAIGDAEIKLLEIQERITGQRSEQLVNEQALLKEKKDKKIADDAEQKAKEDAAEEERKSNIERDREAQLEIDEYELQRKRDLGEATLEDELAFLEKKRLQDVSNEDLRQSEIDAINKKYKLASEKIAKSLEKSTEESEKAKLDAKIGATAEAFGITKEVALVESAIGLGKSIGDAWAANAKLGFPQNVVATASQIAGQIPPIIQSIASIKSARFSKGGGSKGGGGGSSGGAVASAASVQIPTATTTAISDLTASNEARSGIDSSIGSSASRTASANVSGSSSGKVVFSEGSYKNFQNQVAFKEDKSTI